MQRDAQSSNTTNHLCVPVAKLLVQPSLVLLEPYQERLQSIPQTSSVAIHRSRIQLQQQPSTAHSHFVATSLVHPGLSWHGSQCLHSLLEIQAASSALLGCGILMAPMLQPPGPQQPRLVGLAWPGTAQLLGQAQAMFSRHNPPALPPPFPGTVLDRILCFRALVWRRPKVLAGALVKDVARQIDSSTHPATR